jgi:hypothetical protein
MDVGPTASSLDAAQWVTVRDVVRAVITNVAAEELPVVDGLVRFDDDTVVRRLRGRGKRREPLGFGWTELADLATPVVWLAVDQAARQIGKAVGDGATRGTKALLRKVLRRPPAPVTVPPLTHDQLAGIREHVLKISASRGLDRDRAEDLANAIYTTLSLKPAELKSTVDSPPDGGTEV